MLRKNQACCAYDTSRVRSRRSRMGRTVLLSFGLVTAQTRCYVSSAWRSTRVMLGHACETLAVMYLQRGSPIAENKSTTHRTHGTHRTLSVRKVLGCVRGMLTMCLWVVRKLTCFSYVETFTLSNEIRATATMYAH
jgi:hypothetical protein